MQRGGAAAAAAAAVNTRAKQNSESERAEVSSIFNSRTII